MKNIIYSISIALLVMARADATPIFTPLPDSISGQPGSIVGWGFSVTPDPVFAVSVIDSFVLVPSDPSFGSYTDIISYAGGPSAGMLLPGDPNWVEGFHYDPDPSLQTGLGWFQIDPSTPVGGIYTALAHIDYELFIVGGQICPCYVATESAEVQVRVTTDTVTTPTPEPATGALVVIAGAGLLVFSRRTKARWRDCPVYSAWFSGALGVAIAWRGRRRCLPRRDSDLLAKVGEWDARQKLGPRQPCGLPARSEVVFTVGSSWPFCIAYGRRFQVDGKLGNRIPRLT
jgi:hypothetical protein